MKPAPAASDPFVGFNLDQKRVQRVNWFLDVVRTKTSIDVTSRNLAKETCLSIS
ncbi:MAG: hypothetical protein WA705_07665 [Candidatus Ozemobacteraceae bacterium]